MYGEKNLDSLDDIVKKGKKLFVGVIDGRNIWKANLDKKYELIKKIAKKIDNQNLYIGTSCSLLHVPCALKYEEKLFHDIKNWLSFAYEKIQEVSILILIVQGKNLNKEQKVFYETSRVATKNRLSSLIVHDNK